MWVAHRPVFVVAAGGKFQPTIIGGRVNRKKKRGRRVGYTPPRCLHQHCRREGFPPTVIGGEQTETRAMCGLHTAPLSSSVPCNFLSPPAGSPRGRSRWLLHPRPPHIYVGCWRWVSDVAAFVDGGARRLSMAMTWPGFDVAGRH